MAGLRAPARLQGERTRGRGRLVDSGTNAEVLANAGAAATPESRIVIQDGEAVAVSHAVQDFAP